MASPPDRPARETRLAELHALAARAKERQAGAEAVPGLLSLLTEPDAELRNAATTALGWIAHRAHAALPDLLHPATSLLNDPFPMCRHDGAWILESLAERGLADGAGLPLLVRNLDDADADVRAASAFALGWLARVGHPAPQAVARLGEMAATASERPERMAATFALESLGADQA